MTGQVISVNPEAITITGDPNYGLWEHEILATEIEKIEQVYRSEGDKQNNRLAIIAALTGLVITLYLGFRHGMSQLN